MAVFRGVRHAVIAVTAHEAGRGFAELHVLAFGPALVGLLPLMCGVRDEPAAADEVPVKALDRNIAAGHIYPHEYAA